jgi:proteasome alpha subunit
MSQPTFYVSPEQQVKDRADFARAGIAKGRSVIVARYCDGILFVTENRSKTLHKVAEIHDRIGFAAVGRYNEFESLRVAGIRHADIRGYAYARHDVTARMLAGAYAQLLGTIFSAVMEKPYEVEMVVAEVGLTPDKDEIYRLGFDGSISDEASFAVIGGAFEAVGAALRETYSPDLSLPKCFQLAVKALDSRDDVQLTVESLEVALLDRARHQGRKFRRLCADEVQALALSAPKARQSRARKPVSPPIVHDASQTTAKPRRGTKTTATEPTSD